MNALRLLPLALLFVACEKEDPVDPAPAPVYPVPAGAVRNFTITSNVPLCVNDPLITAQISEGTYSGSFTCFNDMLRGLVDRSASVTVRAIADTLNPEVSVHFQQTKDGVIVFDTTYTVTDTVNVNVFNYGVPN
jgi:hypothetical protein